MMPPGLNGLLAPVVTPGALFSRARSWSEPCPSPYSKKPPEPRSGEAQREERAAAATPRRRRGV